MDWIDRNQLGRRNLTPDQMSLIRGRMYNRTKKQGERTDLTSAQSEQRLTSAEVNTRDEISKASGLSHDTISKADFIGQHADEDTKQALRAERKMGEMLQATDRAKGASAGGIKESPRGSYIVPRDTQPTLSELGVTKRESSDVTTRSKGSRKKWSNTE